MTREQTVTVAGRTLRVSNLDKVLYPATGTTKADVLDYYARVAHVLIPQAAWRPATRKRWPDGVGTEDAPGTFFFRKDLEDSAPDWVPRATIEHREHTNTYPLVNDPAVLAWLGQVAALEIHTPQWRFDAALAPANPDRLVFDLDPGPGVTLPEVAEVARRCREILLGMGMDAVPVTSGSKGIHLYAPLDGRHTSDEASAVARELARALEADHPDEIVSTMTKSAREGKVFVDWSQNNGSKTTICPYSLRGRTHPMVATPRTWEELEDPDLAHLDMEAVLERVESGLDPIAGLGWVGAGAPADAESGAAATVGPDLLETYRSMRDASKTPEPVPAEPLRGSHDAPIADGANAPSFVIQEHHASRLHWDFRLEHAGVLVSWAVPKGPPLERDENRLAVQTEDHPLDYGGFEGTIPKGEYGAGPVSIWDAGTIEIEKWREGKEVIAVLQGRADGGLGGVPRRYALIRTHGMGRGGAKDDRNWLLHLMKEQPDAVASAPHSSASQTPRRADGPAAPGPRSPASTRANDDEALITPMLATLGTAADITGDDEWAFEMKWDGVRAVAAITPDGGVILRSRTGRDMTATYPELAALADVVDPAVRESGLTIVDGEIVALDEGRPDFGLLQQRIGLSKRAEVESAMAATPVKLMVFDLLRRGGDSLLRRTYRERRDALFETLREADPILLPHADHGDLDHAMALSRRLRLEGVVAKRESSVYQPGKRGRSWVKVKHSKHQEVVVVGWRAGRGGRSGGIGSLLVAVPDADGVLHYAGRVGSGFAERDLDAMESRFRQRTRKTPPLDDVPASDRRDATWIRPDLVGEVRYTEMTDEGRFRHPVWRGWRPDKAASEVRWE